MDSFTVTDGAVTSIGGQRNFNVPGDDDGSADGSIDTLLTYPGVDGTKARIAGSFVYRATSGTVVTTQTFTVLQKICRRA